MKKDFLKLGQKKIEQKKGILAGNALQYLLIEGKIFLYLCLLRKWTEGQMSKLLYLSY